MLKHKKQQDADLCYCSGVEKAMEEEKKKPPL